MSLWIPVPADLPPTEYNLEKEKNMIRKVLTILSIPLLFTVASLASAGSSSYCDGLPNSVGTGAVMQWNGPFHPSLGSLAVDGCPADSFGMVVYSLGDQDIPFGDGRLCVGPPAWILSRTRCTPQGTALVDIRREGDAEDLDWLFYHFDATWYFQFLYRDPAGPGGTGFNLSNALEVTFQ
jgi:hypothetical protein